jgi:hypothetical protein
VSRAALAALVGLVAVAGVVAAVALGRSSTPDDGASSGGGGRLAWEGEPQVFTPKTLPHDRILTADLRNDTLKEIDVKASRDVELLDRSGRKIQHTAIFTEGFSRDIYPPRYRRTIPLQDQLRLGLRAKIKPGQIVPVTVSWRVRSPDRAAVRLRMPGGELRVPSTD